MAAEQDGGRRVRRGRGLLVALAVLVPAIPLAIGIAIGLGQPSASRAPTVTTTAGFTPVAPTSPKPLAKARSPALPAVPGGPGALVALVRHPTKLRAAPGGPTVARLATRTKFGSAETLLVVKRTPGWLGV